MFRASSSLVLTAFIMYMPAGPPLVRDMFRSNCLKLLVSVRKVVMVKEEAIMGMRILVRRVQ